MKQWVIFLSVILLFLPPTYGIKFNEIMYDVIGTDDNNEWFELFNENNVSVDMNGWKFFEGGTNHNLVAVAGDLIISPKEYFVVTEDAATFLALYKNYSGTLLDSTFSFSNTGESIALRNKTGQLKDNITYSFLWGGNENGYSIGLHNNVWKETFPTPGKTNAVTNICDWKVSVLLDKLIFDSGTEFSWKIRTEKILGESSLVTIKRSITDEQGNLIKSYNDLVHNITNRETLSLDPNLKPGTYLIETEIIPSCNDTNKENNVYKTLFAIKEKQEKSSSVEINTIYDLGKDKTATFGQLIRVKIIAYKGDSTKNVISLWIEGKDKVSKVFKFDMNEKFSKQELTVPIQIFSNCENKLKNGTYTVVAEGFGQKDEKKFEVAGNAEDSCVVEKAAVEKKKTSAKQSSSVSTPQANGVFNQERPFHVSSVIFESSQKKAEKLVPYMAGAVMTATMLFMAFTSKI